MTIGERGALWFIRCMTYFVVAVAGYVILDIVVHGIGVVNWTFLTTSPTPDGRGGIFPAIVGTVYLVLGTIVVALPLGTASAIFLTEYATQGRLTNAIRLAIVTLAGVPSIVFGVFGLGLFVLFLGFGTSIVAGSLTLACMILPTIIVASEESLRAVPQTLREASLALGATKWETVRKSVLPYAIPGMITGSILGVGRAAGETAPILFTAAAFYLPFLPHSVFDEVMALPYHLFVLATQYPDADTVRPTQYGTAFVLLLLVLGLNIGAIGLRIHFRKRNQW